MILSVTGCLGVNLNCWEVSVGLRRLTECLLVLGGVWLRVAQESLLPLPSSGQAAVVLVPCSCDSWPPKLPQHCTLSQSMPAFQKVRLRSVSSSEWDPQRGCNIHTCLWLWKTRCGHGSTHTYVSWFICLHDYNQQLMVTCWSPALGPHISKLCYGNESLPSDSNVPRVLRCSPHCDGAKYMYLVH